MGFGKLVLAFAAAAFLGLLGFAFIIPREVRVQRSVRVEASPEAVFELVEDLRRHDSWMPWGALDPRPQVVFGRQTRGAGATYFWIGDHRTHGIVTLEAVDPPRSVSAAVDLVSVDKARLEFRFEPAGDGVNVTAEFRKDLGFNPIRRYLSASHRNQGEALLESALARLKQVAESLRPAPVEIEAARADTVF